jgi:hypothetical protein
LATKSMLARNMSSCCRASRAVIDAARTVVAWPSFVGHQPTSRQVNLFTVRMA